MSIGHCGGKDGAGPRPKQDQEAAVLEDAKEKIIFGSS